MSSSMPGVMALQVHISNLSCRVIKVLSKKKYNLWNIDKCSEMFVLVVRKYISEFPKVLWEWINIVAKPCFFVSHPFYSWQFHMKLMTKIWKWQKIVAKSCFFLSLFPPILDSFLSNWWQNSKRAITEWQQVKDHKSGF